VIARVRQTNLATKITFGGPPPVAHGERKVIVVLTNPRTAVRAQLATNARNHRRKADAAEPSLLAGLLLAEDVALPAAGAHAREEGVQI